MTTQTALSRWQARLLAAFATALIETGTVVGPMPEWRERQIRRLMSDAPEPVFWGEPLRVSLWVLAFVATAAVAYSLGAAHEGVAMLSICR